ncbi:MAG TPA: hypothetical protein VIA18_22055 [Polyangia bacterium]|jgi:hypothetical protein|nr:hypothetical protein [Polyangia bacterium]
MTRAGALLAFVGLAATVASCWDTTFHCTRDDQCVLAGAVGRCEATRYCSIPSESCASGRVYAPHSPLAGSCVPGVSDGGDDGGPAATCGNGQLDTGEACDPAIVAPNNGACPLIADCDDHNPCTTDSIDGAAAQCSARCAHTFVTACGPADGCCVTGCTPVTDVDCSATCGNGILDPAEQCDNAIAAGLPGACPTSCLPKNGCTSYMLIGDASVCTAVCVMQTTMTCGGALSSDGCCPTGCTLLNDGDCA